MTGFEVGAATHVGMVRDSNQDRLIVDDPVFAVADGMGGHSGGEIAAAIAVDVLAATQAVVTIDDLIERVHEANLEIVERARREPRLRGMGTTVCILAGLGGDGPDRLGVANVGDSRLYRVTDGGLHQHTEDHSLVESLIREGRLTREEARVHPQRNIVTRALGIDERVLVDAWELVPVAGDRYLLCSDGLFGEVPATEIHDVLTGTESAQAAADRLVEQACAAGGRDNVTVVIVDVVEADPPVQVPADRVAAVRRALPEGVLPADRPSAPEPVDVHPPPYPAPWHQPVSGLLTWRLVLFIAVLVVVLVVLVAAVSASTPGVVSWVEQAQGGSGACG